MASDDIELEIKHPLNNPEEVKQFLDKHAKPISKEVYQKDSYYSPTHRDFLDFKFPFEWLRLRESDKGMSINYKHFYPEDTLKTDYCDEFESKVEDIESVKKIFNVLDLKEIEVVEKVRSTWLFDDVEIMIDSVKELGEFIELEATKNFKDPLEGKEYLRNMLKKLNADIGPEDFTGYPMLLIEKKRRKEK